MELTGQEKLLEPIKFYKTELAQKFLDKISAIFDKLLKDSNIDIEANRKSVEEYNVLLKAKKKCESKLKWLKRLSIVVIIVIAFFCFEQIRSIKHLQYLMKYEKETQRAWMEVARAAAILLGLILFNFQYLRLKKKGLIKKIGDLNDEVDAKRDECYSQVNPLLSLFDSGMANKVITEVIPTLNIDEHFKIERYADLVNNFDLSEKLAENMSTKDIISGDILGNPFLIVRSICNEVVDEVYTGSITVSWTEHYTDSEGKRQSRTVTQTLTASLVRPKQVFNDAITLVYANNASEHLTFSREPGFIHELTPRKLARHIKKKTKALRKKSDRAISKGESFLEMGNPEFDVLFNALDRDHEVEFRVLFTPIAQRNMLELLKDKEFGDEFTFNKMMKLNTVNNGRDWVMNIHKSYYKHFSYDTIKEKYFDVNERYFNNFYRLFLPILSIPVYHQHKAEDYIYGNDYHCKYNPYTSEVMANLVGQRTFSHSETVTPSILKTKTIKSSDDGDYVEVKSRSYKTIIRTEYVPRTARNGRTYQVPVSWPEYIPLSAVGHMQVTNINDSEKEFEKNLRTGGLKELKGKQVAYRNKVVAYSTN